MCNFVYSILVGGISISIGDLENDNLDVVYAE